jgi:hypothetical protein
MQALMVVAPHIATELMAEFRDRVKRPAVDDVGLEGVEERFHVRVLARSPAARHALLHTTGYQARPKLRAQKLAAAIAVKDQAGPGLAAPKRRVARLVPACRPRASAAPRADD